VSKIAMFCQKTQRILGVNPKKLDLLKKPNYN
jgi:hypothetical protein